MKEKKEKGSLSIFSALILLLVASLLFTFLESARMYGLRAKSHRNTMLCAESALAEYQIELLENYDVFYLDLGYGERSINLARLKERIMNLSQDNINPKKDRMFFNGANLYRMNVTQCMIEDYELATDDGGAAFMRQAVASMKDNIPYDVAESLFASAEEVKKTENMAENPEQMMADAKAKIAEERARKTEENRQKQENGEEIQPLEDVENPVEFADSLKTSGVLTKVVENPGDLSVKGIDLSDSIETRDKQCGMKQNVSESTLSQKAVYQMYLQQHFGCYTESIENRVLDYEMEYLIAGKATDQENLESVVKRLLALREASNLISLVMDPAKTADAKTVALLLVGFTGNEGVIEAAKYGVMAAWAYVESILDVRTLLSGGKIAIMKKSNEWTTDIFHISESFQNAAKAKESDNGLSYVGYLQTFLSLKNQSELNYRVLDLIEKNIRMLSGNHNLCMDSMTQQMTVSLAYEAYPLFFRMVTIGNIKNEAYQFVQKQDVSYF